MSGLSTSTHPPGGTTLTDRQITRRILPLLAACALGLVPFTVYSNFLVDITRDSGQDAELMGWLRGTGGVAALLVGLCCAPLLDRLSRGAAAAGGPTRRGVHVQLRLVGSELGVCRLYTSRCV